MHDEVSHPYRKLDALSHRNFWEARRNTSQNCPPVGRKREAFIHYFLLSFGQGLPHRAVTGPCTSRLHECPEDFTDKIWGSQKGVSVSGRCDHLRNCFHDHQEQEKEVKRVSPAIHKRPYPASSTLSKDQCHVWPASLASPYATPHFANARTPATWSVFRSYSASSIVQPILPVIVLTALYRLCQINQWNSLPGHHFLKKKFLSPMWPQSLSRTWHASWLNKIFADWISKWMEE